MTDWTYSSLSSWFYASSSSRSLDVSPWSYPSTTTSSFEIKDGESPTGSTSLRPSAWQRNELIYILATPLLWGLYCGGDDTSANVCVHASRVGAYTCGPPHRTRKARPPEIQGLLARCRSRGLKPKHVPAGPSSEILRRSSSRVTSLSRRRFRLTESILRSGRNYELVY